MKSYPGKVVLISVLSLVLIAHVHAQSTAFTYHGRLNNNGAPVTGAYDMQFSVYDADVGNGLISGPLPLSGVGVTNGLFTARIDFLGGVFTGPPRWLEISVRPAGGGNFTTLNPRQELTSSPYSIRAQTAGTASDVSSGTVVKSLNTLKDNVTLAAGANVTLTPSGNTITIASTGGGAGETNSLWSLNGANVYYNAGKVGIGTPNPNHRLRISTVTPWTANGWGGALELDNAAAIGWRGNAAGNRFGIGQSTGGLYFFATASDPGTTTYAANYHMIINDAGNVGIGTSFPATKLHLAGIESRVRLQTTASNGYSVTEYFTDARTWHTGVGGSAVGAGLANKYYLFDGNAGQVRLVVATNGNVGIGSVTPGGKLEVVGQDAVRLIGFQPFLTLFDENAGYGRGRIQSVAGGLTLITENYLSGVNPVGFLKLDNNGNVGIGSPNPQGKLDIVAQDALRMSGYQPFLTFYDSNAGFARGRIQSVAGDIILEPESYVNGSNPNSAVVIASSGNVSVRTLTIRGGADLAEPFELSATDIPKGSVVIIDDEHPGKLKLSAGAYDTRVAGIISGANGVNPGISLQQDGILDSGQNVALSGRVYVLADAADGAIKPGDLLTTSNTPGHAMKAADHSRAHGAILGKAMSELKAGKGFVLVLVSLQ